MERIGVFDDRYEVLEERILYFYNVHLVNMAFNQNTAHIQWTPLGLAVTLYQNVVNVDICCILTVSHVKNLLPIRICHCVEQKLSCQEMFKKFISNFLRSILHKVFLSKCIIQ